jgi:succinyl-diaminopimelate desuccinylase
LPEALIDSPSLSGHELVLADAIEAALRATPHLEVKRHGNTVAARTHQGLPSRVVWAGHIDTVPANGNDQSSVSDGFVHGRGSVDMKSGVAIGLKLALEAHKPFGRCDLDFL